MNYQIKKLLKMKIYQNKIYNNNHRFWKIKNQIFLYLKKLLKQEKKKLKNGEEDFKKCNKIKKNYTPKNQI